MTDLINFLKKAIAALLALFGIKADEEFVENVEGAVNDVIDYGNGLID